MGDRRLDAAVRLIGEYFDLLGVEGGIDELGLIYVLGFEVAAQEELLPHADSGEPTVELASVVAVEDVLEGVAGAVAEDGRHVGQLAAHEGNEEDY